MKRSLPSLIFLLLSIISIRAQTFSNFSPRQGAVGTPVTITDARLNGFTSVSFNGVIAAAFQQNANTILTQVPAGASTGLITIVVNSVTFTSDQPFVVAAPVPQITSVSPNIGADGDNIQISGQNLGSITSVSFNGVSANFNAVSNNSIVAVVPQNATTGRIIVSGPQGADTSASDFIVTAANRPIITRFDPTSGIAGLTTVTIYGRNFLGNNPVGVITFNNIPAVFGQIVSDTEIIAEVPLGATTGPISVSNGFNAAQSRTNFIVTGQRNDVCYTTGPKDEQPIVPTVQQQTVNIRANTAGFLRFIPRARTSYLFSACNSTTSATVTVYSNNLFIDSNSGFGIACDQSPDKGSLIYTASNTDTVLVLVTNNGCGPVSPGTIISYRELGQPSATSVFPTTANQSSTVRLRGQNLNLVTDVFLGNLQCGINFATPDSLVFTVPFGATTGLIRLIVQTTVINTGLTLNICNLTQPLISTIGNTAICSGRPAILSATPGFSSYFWSNGETSQRISVTEPGNYNVRATDATGCITPVSQNFFVPARTRPTAVVTQRNDTLFAQRITGSYIWRRNGVQAAITSFPFYKMTFPGNYELVVVSNGCTDTARIVVISGLSDNKSIVTRIYPQPAIAHLDIETSTDWSEFNQDQITLINQLGQMIKPEITRLGDHVVRLNTVNLTRGTWMLIGNGLKVRFIVGT